MARIFLKPATKDLKVPMPENGRFLPVDGAAVEQTQYWTRRMLDGDAVLTEAPAPKRKGSPAPEVEAVEKPAAHGKHKKDKKDK